MKRILLQPIAILFLFIGFPSIAAGGSETRIQKKLSGTAWECTVEIIAPNPEASAWIERVVRKTYEFLAPSFRVPAHLEIIIDPNFETAWATSHPTLLEQWYSFDGPPIDLLGRPKLRIPFSCSAGVCGGRIDEAIAMHELAHTAYFTSGLTRDFERAIGLPQEKLRRMLPCPGGDCSNYNDYILNILKRFYGSTAAPQEVFADLVPAIILGDPSIMRKTVETILKGNTAASETATLRDFAAGFSMERWKIDAPSLYSGKLAPEKELVARIHHRFSPARGYLGARLEEMNTSQQHRTLLEAFYYASLDESRRLANEGYRRSLDQMNRDLISATHAEFQAGISKSKCARLLLEEFSARNSK